MPSSENQTLQQGSLFPQIRSDGDPDVDESSSREYASGGSTSCVRTPVAQWARNEQPAEKAMGQGARALSDTELLSILLSRGATVEGELFTTIDVARWLLRKYGSLTQLARRLPLEMTHGPGIGRQTAARLAATFEIGRRVESQRSQEKRVQVCSPDDVAAVYGPLMRDLQQEIFKVVMLNTANVILGDYTTSEGGLAASIVEPRAVFKQAILDNAAAVICLHNHPSGNPEPSREDIRITRQLVEAGQIMGIPVHDHLIIAGPTFTSLAERGVLTGSVT